MAAELEILRASLFHTPRNSFVSDRALVARVTRLGASVEGAASLRRRLDA